MNSIIRYHPWQHVRKAMLNKKLYPPSIIHTKKIKQPPSIPQKELDKKSERNNDSKNQPPKKKPIGVIYF